MRLARGTVLYHGTGARKPFRVPDRLAWLTDVPATAREFAGYMRHEPARGGPRRVLALRLTAPVRLVRFDSAREMDLFVALRHGYGRRDVEEMGEVELAAALGMGDDVDDDDMEHLATSHATLAVAREVCDAGFDGWVVPGNYAMNEGGDDIMLCHPGDHLELAGVEWIDPRPKGKDWKLEPEAATGRAGGAPRVARFSIPPDLEGHGTLRAIRQQVLRKRLVEARSISTMGVHWQSVLEAARSPDPEQQKELETWLVQLRSRPPRGNPRQRHR